MWTDFFMLFFFLLSPPLPISFLSSLFFNLVSFCPSYFYLPLLSIFCLIRYSANVGMWVCVYKFHFVLLLKADGRLFYFPCLSTYCHIAFREHSNSVSVGHLCIVIVFVFDRIDIRLFFPYGTFYTRTYLIIGGGQYAIFKSDTFRVNSTHLVNIILLLNGMHETSSTINTVATGTKLKYNTTTFGPLLFIDEKFRVCMCECERENYSIWFLYSLSLFPFSCIQYFPIFCTVKQAAICDI